MIAIADVKLAISNSAKGDNGWDAQEICELITDLTGITGPDGWAVAYSIVENARRMNIFDPNNGRTGHYVAGADGKEANLDYVTVSDVQLSAALTAAVARVDGNSGDLGITDIRNFADDVREAKDANGAAHVSSALQNIRGFGNIANIKGTDLFTDDDTPAAVADAGADVNPAPAGNADAAATETAPFYLAYSLNKVRNYFSPENLQMLQYFAYSMMSYMFASPTNRAAATTPPAATTTPPALTTRSPAAATASPFFPIAPVVATAPATTTPQTQADEATPGDPPALTRVQESSLPLGAVLKPLVAIPPRPAA